MSFPTRCIVRPSHKCAAGDCRWRGCHEADDSSVDARALPPRHHVEAHRASERAYTISQVFRSIDGARGIPRQDRAERGAAAFSREKKKKVIGYGTNQTSIRDWPRVFDRRLAKGTSMGSFANSSSSSTRATCFTNPHVTLLRPPRGAPQCSCPFNFSHVNRNQNPALDVGVRFCVD